MKQEQRKKRQVGCSNVNLGQTEAKLQKLSKLQMSHMSSDKMSSLASRQKARIALAAFSPNATIPG